MRHYLLASVLALTALGSSLLFACSEDDSNGSSEDDVTSRLRREGESCTERVKCEPGLLCKARPSGPPPGAVGMPAKPEDSTASTRPPPGAMGMPAPQTTCQKPAPGELGGSCSLSQNCNEGLSCVFGESSGPPPGAVGMPVPPPTSTSTSSAPPPGAMGMPLFREGICRERSGPPPGALGMPIKQ